MEIKGEEFMKEVQVEEQNKIKQKLDESKDSQTVHEEFTNVQNNIPPKLDKEIKIQEEQEYSDIMLGNSINNEINKKRYLILGLILVILFLLTIIIIRLLTNDNSSNDSFAKTKETENQKVLENENIEEQYQKIINEKLQNIKKEKEKVVIEEEKIDEKLNLQKIDEKEKVIKKVQEVKPDISKIKKEELVEVSPKVTKEEPTILQKVVEKKVSKPIVKKSTTKSSKSTLKPKGTFVQIGAFSKMPSKKYLNDITKKGFKYRVYKVSINNKLFHKVLIGPYNSRKQAKQAIENIKRKLNISGAFILTL